MRGPAQGGTAAAAAGGLAGAPVPAAAGRISQGNNPAAGASAGRPAGLQPGECRELGGAAGVNHAETVVVERATETAGEAGVRRQMAPALPSTSVATERPPTEPGGVPM